MPKSVRRRPAPAARAASTTPGSTPTRFCSTTRPMTTAAMSAIGKTAAPVPIVVPSRASVTGPTAVMKMMNGTGRTMLTTRLRTAKTTGCSSRLPGRVA